MAFRIAKSSAVLKLFQRTIFARPISTSHCLCFEESKAETKDVKIVDIPKPALYLGFGGAIPFVSLALTSMVATEPYVNYIATAQTSYAACILTFLGGVHWGKELMLNKEQPSMRTLTLSVIPSLYAWSAFALPPSFAMYYLSTGLVAVAVHDVNDSTLPAWYRKLRIPLSLLAASSIATTGYFVS